MAAYEVLLLNTAIPQIQAAQSGDTYVVPRDIAINATAIISANSATDALRITQTGAGNAILVEDSANPDSTPFVVTAAGDVGIGTSSPGEKLDVRSASNAIGNFQSSSASGYAGINAINGSRSWYAGVRADASNAFGIRDETASATRMLIDTSGNLGLGVTPSAWVEGTGLNVGSGRGGSIFTETVNYGFTTFNANAYYSATNTWKYVTSNAASRYQQLNGVHSWYNAASGTAGNAISFTQAMMLDASGNLGIGLTSGSDPESLGSPYINVKGAVYAFKSSDTTKYMAMGAAGTAGYLIAQTGLDSMRLYAGGSERARITSGGDFQVSSGGSVQVGGTAARATTAGTNRLDIFNGTAPVGTLTNGISIYSSSGEAYVMDAAGNATLFSPHDAETNEWIFKSKHTPTGKVLKIDVERLLKFVNDHFGLDAVHEFVEE